MLVPPVDPAEKSRVQKAYPSEEKKYESLPANLAKRLSESKDDPGDQNARRRKLMSDTLADVADEDFETVTLLGTLDGSAIVGYGHARGFAMSHGVCREAFGNSFTAGTGTGAGMGLDFGTDYVHGWTKLRCEVDCATLDWDDIPLLDSKAGCKQ